MKLKILSCILLTGALGAIAQKPNFLFIFSDDQSYETVAATGNSQIETPNLDKLVNSGITFTHAYNMGAWNGAICLASRLMINTGRSVWRAEELFASAAIQNTEFTMGRVWGKLLESAGYDTYITGKWHLKGDASNAFKFTSVVRPGFTGADQSQYTRPTDSTDIYKEWSPYDETATGFWTGGKHWSVIVAEEAEKFLITAASDPDPFFMYLAFNAPHDPRQAPREYIEKYKWQEIDVPINFLPEYPNYNELEAGPNSRDERLATYPRTKWGIQVHRQEYYASIDYMDHQIGRILTALEATGKADNTYVIFTSDHGLAVGHHGFVGKQNLFEHSTRVPFFIKGIRLLKST